MKHKKQMRKHGDDRGGVGGNVSGGEDSEGGHQPPCSPPSDSHFHSTHPGAPDSPPRSCLRPQSSPGQSKTFFLLILIQYQTEVYFLDENLDEF